MGGTNRINVLQRIDELRGVEAERDAARAAVVKLATLLEDLTELADTMRPEATPEGNIDRDTQRRVISQSRKLLREIAILAAPQEQP